MAFGVRKVNEYIVRDGRALVLTQAVSSGITQAQWDSIGDGTLYLSPTNGDITYKKRGNAPKVWSKFLPGNLFEDEDITGNFIKGKTLTEVKFADNSVSTRTIIGRNVTSPKIALEAILNEHIKDGNISGSKITDLTMNASKLIDLSIATGKYAERSVTTTKLALLSVTSAELANNSVLTDKINALAVTEAKLATNSVTNTKIKDLEVLSSKIANLAITNDKLALKSVNWNNIMDNAIKTTHITDLNVTEAKLSDDSVLTRAIKNLNVTTAKIADKAVTTLKIDDNAVTNAKLDTDTQNILRNAVVHDNASVATVLGDLKVRGNIIADSTALSKTITGFKVYNPLFADYAEGFVPAEPLEEGDIVEIDKDGCVRKASAYSTKVIGVVSERYGFCLDADEEEINSGAKTAVGLMGKVPVNLFGKVEAGDFIVSAGDGYAISTKKVIPGCVVGRALETKDTECVGQVLCLIQPM